MSEFLDLLTVYYTCDVMAGLRPLTSAEFMGCMDVYTAVKQYFAPAFDLAPHGTEARAEQMREAYLGFVAWQQDNPALVANLREVAEARVEG
jgi:hypothetical protein